MPVDQTHRPLTTEMATAAVQDGPVDQSPATELARLAELLGTDVACYDLRSGRIVAATDDSLLPVVPPELMWQCVQTGESRVQPLSSGLICFALPFPGTDSAAYVAVGYAAVADRACVRPTWSSPRRNGAGRSPRSTCGWRRLHHCDPDICCGDM